MATKYIVCKYFIIKMLLSVIEQQRQLKSINQHFGRTVHDLFLLSMLTISLLTISASSVLLVAINSVSAASRHVEWYVQILHSPLFSLILFL